MKRLLIRIWNKIEEIFHKLTSGVKRMVPVAIQVVENIKMLVDSPVLDAAENVLELILNKEIPDRYREKLREGLPKILLGVNVVKEINDLPTDNEKLRAILLLFRNVGADERKMFWHGFAALILELIADGDFSWQDAIVLSEYVKKYETK